MKDVRSSEAADPDPQKLTRSIDRRATLLIERITSMDGTFVVEGFDDADDSPPPRGGGGDDELLPPPNFFERFLSSSVGSINDDGDCTDSTAATEINVGGAKVRRMIFVFMALPCLSCGPFDWVRLRESRWVFTQPF